jgi:hypothetical protein
MVKYIFSCCKFTKKSALDQGNFGGKNHNCTILHNAAQFWCEDDDSHRVYGWINQYLVTILPLCVRFYTSIAF